MSEGDRGNGQQEHRKPGPYGVTKVKGMKFHSEGNQQPQINQKSLESKAY